MTISSRRLPSLASLAVLGLLAGCRLPGRPGPDSTPQRPDAITNFHTLYSTNCAACHGVEGRRGMAVSLADPAYLAYAGEDNIASVTAKGIPGSLMPAFARSSGGLLTDQQIRVLADGMVERWSNPASLHGQTPPPYRSHATGTVGAGAAAFGRSCAKCHAPGQGSILDPTYLQLVSDGGLRTILVAGKPESGMPDWADYPGGPLTDQTLADLVTYLASHRIQHPGQPFPAQRDGHSVTPLPANPLAPSSKGEYPHE